MTNENLALPLRHACAVFGENGLVLASAAYNACFGCDYRPSLAMGDLAFVHEKEPMPHVVLRRDFSLDGEPFVLFLMVLYDGEERRREAELALNRVNFDVGYLLLVATNGGKETSCPILELYDSVSGLLLETVSRDIRVSLPLYSMGAVMLDRSALIMALGLLIPDLLASGDVELSLLQEGFFAFSLCLRTKGAKVTPFVATLCHALGKGGGFSLDVTEQGVTFTLSCCETVGHML